MKIGRPQLEIANTSSDSIVAPEDIQYQINTSKLHVNRSINTNTSLQGLSQNRRHVHFRNVGMPNLTITVNNKATVTYSKKGGVNDKITFVAAAGFVLFPTNGTLVMDGKKGSTATMWHDDGEVFIQINNIL